MRVILYMAQTLNGFIARENHEAPWTDTVFQAYYEFIRTHGNLVVGRTTYTIMKSVGEFDHLGDPETVVLSRTAQALPDATVVPSSQEALRHLEAKGFETAVIAGGAQCNASFWQKGLIDDLIIDVEPQLFGKGIPFFAPFGGEAQLKLQEVKELGENVVRLRYNSGK